METSTTSSIISTLGGGSGVDMVQLASDLSEARFLTQVGQLNSRSELLEAKISAAATLKSQLSNLASALGDRIRNGDLAPEATINNGSVAQASVLSGGSAKGSYSLEVSQLASSQTLATQAYSASTDLVGEGQLTIRFGAISGATFTEDSEQTAAVIDVLATDTLDDIAGKINAAEGGLSAYVANTASGAKLVVKGADGEENSFIIEASGASVAGSPAPGALDYLAWHPSTDAGELKSSAASAEFLFDGVAMTSDSNNVTGLPAGLLLTLTGTNVGAPTQINFADKSSEITAMMNDFVSAMNDVAGALAELAAPRGGELGNDPGARTLKRALSNLSTEIVMPNADDGAPNSLADLGLTRTRQGKFSLDADRLSATLANDPAGASAMFTTGLFGVFGTIDNMARNLGSITDPGSLGGSVTRYTDQLSRLDDRLLKIADQQESLRERLVKTFSASDRRVAASQSTLNFLQNQIEVWNNSGR